MIGRYAQQGALGNWAYIDPSIADHFVIAVYENDDLTGAVVRIPNSQAPALALAILTAAGVTHAPYDAADSLQRALAQLEEHEGIRRNQEAKQELTKRRDELAAKLFDLPVYELHPGPFDYADSTEVVRNAIDMIIQLQDEATK